MDILFLLVPLSALLVFAIIGVFAWALHGGQFENVEREGERILDADSHLVDSGQSMLAATPEQSRHTHKP
jgi:cbb3-type cytochrome oxidase maturation protein